jgi:predicted transcriptional regulator
MPKNPIAMRLSDDAVRLLERLAKALGLSKTAVVELALRALARSQKINTKE